MKNFIRKSVLPLAISATLVSYSAFAQSKNSGSSSSSKSSSTPNYGGSSSSYKYNAPTYSGGSSSSSKSPSSSSSSSSSYSKPSYSSSSSSSSSSSKPNYGSSSSSYSKPSYSYGSSSSSSSSSSSKSSTYTAPSKPSVPSYSGSSSSSSSKPNYGSTSSSGSYKYNPPTYSGSSSSSSSSSNKTTTVTPRPTVPSYNGSSSSSSSSSKPNYGSTSSSGSYKYNPPTYSNNNSGSSSSSSSNKTTVTPRPTVPSYNGSTSSNNSSSNRPNYGQSSSTPNYKYNDYTVSKPKYEVGKPVQNNNGNNSSYNRPPQTNKNGTVLLKELKPGQSRVRADGTTDQVHKDGKGYTHTFTDKNGTVRKESIRYDKTGKEVKISDTARQRNGDVITTYKSGVQEVRTRDGLRYQNDRYGRPVYKEQYSTWNNRPVIQRHYQNNYTTIYVQNNYYGYPTYFYRPSYYDYSYYSYVLSPWRNPYQYSWHWSYNPWYYSYYRPYPVYYSPAYWLTDYLIMSLIQSNYERIAADREVLEVQAQYTNQVALSEAVKEEIRAQVESSLRQQQSAVQNNTVMDPAQILKQGRLMVVHDDLNVEDENGSQCQLDEGDILRLINQPTAETPIAELKVVSAKGTSCPAGTTLSLSAQNLIDMENEFQSRIQQGMTEMKEKNVGTTKP